MIEKLKKTLRINGIKDAWEDGLDAFGGGLAGKQTLSAYNEVVFEGKMLGNVGAVFVIKNTCTTTFDQVNRSTTAADGLDVLVFCIVFFTDDGSEGCFSRRRERL